VSQDGYHYHGAATIWDYRRTTPVYANMMYHKGAKIGYKECEAEFKCDMDEVYYDPDGNMKGAADLDWDKYATPSDASDAWEGY